MRPYRAIPINGKDFVYGYAFVLDRKYYIIHQNAILQSRDSNYKLVLDEQHNFIEVIPETVSQQTGLKDKNGLTDIYEYDIIGVDGLIKGNQYENPNLLQDKTNLVVPAITSEDWQEAYRQAMVRGCKHAK